MLCPQGKFIRIHFGPSGKIAGADIEQCTQTARMSYSNCTQLLFRWPRVYYSFELSRAASYV